MGLSNTRAAGGEAGGALSAARARCAVPSQLCTLLARVAAPSILASPRSCPTSCRLLPLSCIVVAAQRCLAAVASQYLCPRVCLPLVLTARASCCAAALFLHPPCGARLAVSARCVLSHAAYCTLREEHPPCGARLAVSARRVLSPTPCRLLPPPCIVVVALCIAAAASQYLRPRVCLPPALTARASCRVAALFLHPPCGARLAVSARRVLSHAACCTLRVERGARPLRAVSPATLLGSVMHRMARLASLLCVPPLPRRVESVSQSQAAHGWARACAAVAVPMPAGMSPAGFDREVSAVHGALVCACRWRALAPRPWWRSPPRGRVGASLDLLLCWLDVRVVAAVGVARVCAHAGLLKRRPPGEDGACPLLGGRRRLRQVVRAH